jgi:hypothetical protein
LAAIVLGCLGAVASVPAASAAARFSGVPLAQDQNQQQLEDQQQKRKPKPPSPPPPAPQAQVCVLRVPDEPLSAAGLAMPYRLAGPGCHEQDPNTAAFAQAAVLDPATGQISVYDPLVVDAGARPAIAPVVPTLPPNAVVAVWIGFNGNALRVEGDDQCVGGVAGSIFGQNAFCNATAFFAAANAAIKAGKLVPPPLGTAKDGRPCPSTRDFSVVDQDQSDNTTTQYLVTASGQVAQDTPANRARLSGAHVQFNGSDERLVAVALDHALGCTPWTAPDLADASHTQRLPALPLNELQAAAHQAPPVALVPALDPFAMVSNQPNLRKLNAFRAGVDQPAAATLAAADTKAYCQNLYHVGLPRLAADKPLTNAASSPFPTLASTLFDFLAMRFQGTFSNDQGFLQCQQLLGVKDSPVTLHTTNGVVTGAEINLKPIGG